MAEKKNEGSAGSWVDNYQSEVIMNELKREFVDDQDETPSTTLSSSEQIQQHFQDVQKTIRQTRFKAMLVLIGKSLQCDPCATLLL